MACELPPPMFGKDVKVKLARQGFLGFDADFDVLDLQQVVNEKGEEQPTKWLLLDVRAQAALRGLRLRHDPNPPRQRCVASD